MVERTTVGALLRSAQAFCGQLCEKETLDFGIAYYCPRFPALPEVNQFREVLIDDPRHVSAAFEQAESWFVSRGLRCRRWAPAGGKAVPELRSFLEDRGFRPRTWTAMVLSRWTEGTVAEGLRLVPARAVRAAFHETFLRSDRGTPAEREALAEAYSERLDDPSMDMFVALVGGEPAGRAALHQVGDIGRILDLTTLPAFAGRGVEEALLCHVLALGKRLMMKLVCTQVEHDNAPRRRLLESAGFVPDGEIIEFDRAD